MIVDSGTRREFDTGAVRDIAEGKGRMDLCPLDLIGKCIGGDAEEILTNLELFKLTGAKEFIEDALNDFIETYFDDPCTAMLEYSIHTEEGCSKYGDYNWQRGMPWHTFLDSGARHFVKHLRGDDDERHDRAFVWNMMSLLWMIDHKPELNDLPIVKWSDADE